MIRNLFGGAAKCRTIDKLDIFGDGSCKALYRLDGNANDESGNYHGTETAITYGGGVYERGVVIQSSKIDLGVGSKNLMPYNGSYSISVWVKRETGKLDNQIVNKSNIVSGYYGDTLNWGTDNKIYLGISKAQSTLSYWNTGAINATDDGVFHHIVAIIDRASTAKLYFDGVLQTWAVTQTMANSWDNNVNVSIGGLTDAWTYQGKYDQVRIFNRAITTQEATILYAECEPTSIVDNINPFEDGSLKALYKFDNDVTDATGVYNGVATNVTYASGKFGNCAVFGGSTVNAKVTSPYQFPSGGNAISIWAKVDSANQSAACLFGYLAVTRQSFLRADYNLLSAGAWMHRLPSGEKICTNLDEWYHVVYTSNGSEPLKLYVNGVLRTNLIVTNFNWTTFAIDGLGFYLTSSTENLTGKLDQLRIFNKALTPLEVASLYNETTPMEEPMSVQVDPFKDGSGKALYRLDGNALDESGNYNGTPTGLTYGLGRFGRSGVFNGSSTRINTSFANFASTGVTVSMWVNIVAHKNYNYIMNFYENNSFIFASDSTGAITFGGAGTIISSAYTVGQWLHVVGTITAGGFATLYINGSSVGTTTSALWFSDTNKNDTFGCGNPSLGTYSSYLNGSLDQVRIFNKALTQSEVTALYNEI